MIIYNFEEDLKSYCKFRDGKLFEERLYSRLLTIANHICNKRKITKRELEDGLALDMVSHLSITLPEYYDESKGLAKNASYILMNQYLLQQREYKNQSKRSNLHTFYIEELEESGCLIEIEFDELKFMKSSLLERKETFLKIKDKFTANIASQIIDCIQYPENYECNFNSYVKSIAKKANSTIQQVYSTISIMRELLATT